MACRGLTKPVKKSLFICDGCLSNARAVPHGRSTAARSFSTASSSPRGAAPSRPSQLSLRHYRPQLIESSVCPRRKPLRTHRAFSSEVSSTNPLQAGITPLPHRRLLSLSGQDAAKFLQGLVTNNVDSTRLSPFYTAFLDARGRVLWDVFIWVWPELVAEKTHWACYIEVDGSELEALKKHLKKHKLRSKVKIEEVAAEGEDGICVWAVWGGAHEFVKEWSEIAGMRDSRGDGLYRYLARADRESVAEGARAVETRYYHIQRYIQGVAEGPAEIPRENALPMEYNVDLSGGIDFKKGCYVGQELTIRTKHTGVVRKRVLPVRLHQQSNGGKTDFQVQTDTESSSILPEPGTDIKAINEAGELKKGRPTGRFIAGIGNVGLALCRLENMTPMRVSAEGGTFKEGAEFGVDVDGTVTKVVPVLHPWFVQRKEALWDTKKENRRKIIEVEDD